MRRVRARRTDRPALLGDRDHTRRMARRLGMAVFLVTLLILSPLAYGLAQASSSRFALSGTANMVLVGFVVLAIAAATGIAADMSVHLLGSEARARRKG